MDVMEPWIILLTILVTIISIHTWYLITYFKNAGVPYATPFPFFGNVVSVYFKRKHMFPLIKELYDRWPNARYFGMYNFSMPVIVIRDPEIIKDITVKHFDSFVNHTPFFDPDIDPLFGKSLFSLKGDKWRQVRQTLTPAFTSSKMKSMFKLMSKCAVDFADYLVDHAAKHDIDIDIKDAFTRYTNDVIASCAFGVSVDSMRNPNNDFYVFGTKAINFDYSAIVKLFIHQTCPYLAKRFDLGVFNSKMTRYFKSIVENTIKTRLKEGIVRPDMLQLMMDTKKTSSELDIDDMTAHAFGFFFGGFDSTSTLMSMAAMLLSVNPQVQEKLLEEIDVVFKETNGHPTYEAINDMAYLEGVLYETMRLFPTAGFVERLCNNSFELPPAVPGGKSFVINPGMSVWIPACGIHQDPVYYPDPKAFKPERFVENKAIVTQPTYLSFGIGPRSCIGNRFALLEAKLVLFHLLAKCRFQLSNKTKVPFRLKLVPFVILLEGGSWLRVVPRDTNSFLLNK